MLLRISRTKFVLNILTRNHGGIATGISKDQTAAFVGIIRKCMRFDRRPSLGF